MLLVLVAVVFILSMDQRINNKDIISEFESAKIEVEIYNSDDLRYYRAKSAYDSETAIVFIHGAPGNGAQFHPYMMNHTLRNLADIYTLDRPGYGYSNYGKAAEGIADQAEIILNALSSVIDSSQKIILVSHSFGGPIASYMGIQKPEQIKGHLMLNPVIDPVSEPMFWYSKVPIIWPFSMISSGAMKVAAYEKIVHPDELKKAEHLWRHVTTPTLMIQGKKDWLAPLDNAEYVRDHFPSDYVDVRVLEEKSHFIPFSDVELVVDLIIKLLSQIQ